MRYSNSALSGLVAAIRDRDASSWGQSHDEEGTAHFTGGYGKAFVRGGLDPRKKHSQRERDLAANPDRAAYGYTADDVKAAAALTGYRFGDAEGALQQALAEFDGLCYSNLVTSSERVAAFRARQSAKGKCTVCGQRKARTGRATCTICNDAAKERVRAARARKNAA